MPRFTELTEMPRVIPTRNPSEYDGPGRRGLQAQDVNLRAEVQRELAAEADDRGMHVPDLIALIVTDVVIKDADKTADRGPEH